MMSSTKIIRGGGRCVSVALDQRKTRSSAMLRWALISLLATAFWLALPQPVEANSGGITGRHGYPTNTAANTCRSSGCHDSGNFAAGTVSISLGAPASVPHNTASNTGFSISGGGGTRRGFNLAIYQGSTKQTTAFTNLSTGVEITSNELNHISPQNIGSWTYRWTSPAALGTYRIYACLNPVNNDGDRTSDGAAKCTTRDFTVFNTAPNAVNNLLAITVSEDATAYSSNVNMLSNDVATETDTFAWLSHDVATIQGDLNRVTGGTYRYRPGGAFESLDTGDTATETFTYTIRETGYTGATQCQGGPCTDTATVTIRVTGVNDAPVAVNNTVTVDIAGTATTVVEGNSTSVLTNDTDADAGEAVKQAQLVSGPSNAAAFTLNANGTFSYTHDGSGAPSDSFTYRVSDGDALSNIATVTITVSNTAPTAVADARGPVLEGGSINFTVLGNDTDPETAVTGVAAGSIGNQVGGTATIQPDNSITFMHDGSETAPASFTYRATDGFLESNDATVTISVTPVNDPPVIGTVADFTATEGVPISFNPGVTDPDDNNDGVDITWNVDSVTPDPGGVTISSTGLFQWTPPLGPPAVFGATYDVVISADDGDVADTESFRITVNPPDGDGDMVADYDDFCPGPPNQAALNSADGSNADNDGDGTAGTDADPNDSVGGDVCDIDDDNDGMPDAFELANSFDPFNAADAAGDADGDGVTNLQEYLDGTNPNQENLIIDATGYFTPFELTPPDPASIHTLATAVTPTFTQVNPVSSDPNGPYRPGNNSITWKPSNGSDDDLATNDPGNLVTNPPTQTFLIRPLATLSVDQDAVEGSVAMVTIQLNGDSPSWLVNAPAMPSDAIVNYTVSGTATNPSDHDAVDGSVAFPPGTYSQTIPVTIAADAIADAGEVIFFSLTSATNAAIGSKNTHSINIVEGNLAPRAELEFTQGGDVVSSTFTGSAITVDAMPTDANVGQTLSCDWSGTDNALLPPGIVADCGTPPNSNWTIAAPVAGTYLVDVVVSDDAVPAGSTRVTRILRIDPPPAVALSALDDSDMDGTDDLTEGYADPDGDGIPAYLDNVGDSNLVPDQTVDLENMLLLETEPGLTLRRGSTSQAANIIGALVSDNDIAQFGSPTGTAPTNAEDSFEHVGGVYDFEIDGLIPGTSVNIVIPLQSSIPRNAEYRKYHPTTGWSNFVEDANNTIASAVGEPGACPEPGSSAYTAGLQYLSNCVQLTIQDGGPNDTDGVANGVINDPATVGVVLTEPEGFEEVEEGSGGGRVSLGLLAILSVLGGIACRRRLRGCSIE